MNQLGMEFIPTGEWTNTQSDWVVKIKRALGMIAVEPRIGTYPAYYFTDPALHEQLEVLYEQELHRIDAILANLEYGNTSAVRRAKNRLEQLLPMVIGTGDVIYSIPINGIEGVPDKYLSSGPQMIRRGGGTARNRSGTPPRLPVNALTMIRTEDIMPESLECRLLASVWEMWQYIHQRTDDLNIVFDALEETQTYGGDSLSKDIVTSTAQTVIGGRIMLHWLDTQGNLSSARTPADMARLGAHRRMEMKNWLITASKLGEVVRSGMKPLELIHGAGQTWQTINALAEAVDGLFDIMDLISMMSKLLIKNGETGAIAGMIHMEGAAGRARWQATAPLKYYVQQFCDLPITFHGISLMGRMPSTNIIVGNNAMPTVEDVPNYDVFTTAPVDGTLKHLAMEYYPNIDHNTYLEIYRQIKSSAAMQIHVADIPKPRGDNNLFGRGNEMTALLVNGGVINQVMELTSVNSLHNVHFAPSVKDRISLGNVIVRRDDITLYDTDFVRDSGTRYYPLLVR